MALRRVGVVCALASEARHLGVARRTPSSASAADGPPLAELSDGTLITVSGMGARAASRGAQALVLAGAAALASWGMAGGLDPALAPGAIVLPLEVQGSDGVRIATDRAWREQLAAAAGPQGAVWGGRLLTTDAAVGSVAAKASLFASTGAVAVDMESAPVGMVAREHGLPFLAVRVVVDSATDNLPTLITAAADAQGQLQVGRLIGALARTPSSLAPLLRLARRYRHANRSLASIARAGALQLA